MIEHKNSEMIKELMSEIECLDLVDFEMVGHNLSSFEAKSAWPLKILGCADFSV